MNFLIAVVLIAVFVGTITVVYWTGRWILGPIDRAAKGRHAPPRVSLSDFLCLFVAVQLPLAFASRLRSEETEQFFWALAAISWVVAPVIWILCARTLSRAGITSGHRFLFLAVVLPIVYYGLIPFILVALGAVARIAGDGGEFLFSYWWAVVAWFCTGAALIGCGWYTNWLCKSIGSNGGPSHSPHEDDRINEAEVDHSGPLSAAS